MSEDKQLVVTQATGNFSMAMFKKIKGLDEDSPLRKMQGQGSLRLAVDGDQFQTKKGSKTLQVIKARDDKNKLRPVKELDVIIHRISPVLQRQAAVKYDPRDPKYMPIGCWSNDGNKPDADCWGKQSSNCDTCKFNGGAEVPHGDEGKLATCGLTRLGVVSLYSPTAEDPADIQLMLMSFNYSSNKVKNNKGEDPDENIYGLINYLRMLAEMEVDTHKVITRIIVDDYSDPKNNCKLLFQPVGVLQDGDPNRLAHDAWVADESTDLDELCEVNQNKPRDDQEDLSEDGGTGGEKTTKKKTTSKKASSKKKTSTKRRKPKPEPEPEPEEEEEEEPEEEEIEDGEYEEVDEEELVEEDDDDFGDLEDLLDDDDDD